MSPARRTRTETTPPVTPVAAFLPRERTLSALREAAARLIATPWAPFWMATYHPSAILRMIEADVRAAAQEALVSDLRQIPKHVPFDVHRAESRPHA